jgi:hypothetical protein
VDTDEARLIRAQVAFDEDDKFLRGIQRTKTDNAKLACVGWQSGIGYPLNGSPCAIGMYKPECHIGSRYLL